MSVIETIDKNSSALIALAGVAAGHLVTISLPFLQRHREKTEAANRLRYWLLEMWWITDETYFIEYHKYIKSALSGVGIVIPDDALKEVVRVFANSFFENLDTKKQESLRKANQGIETHLPSLVNHLPLLAFKISDFANPPEDIDYKKKMSDYLDAAFENESLNGLSDIRKNFLGILDEALSENDLSESIQNGILGLSLANNLCHFFEMKMYFRRQKLKRRKDAKEAAEKVKALMIDLIKKNPDKQIV